MIWENGVTRIERYWDLSYGPKWTYSRGRRPLERIDELLAETVAPASHERRARSARS